ncbi:hypothetical protein LJC45_01600 [Alistipes sp. OttesenSCG-928-B03]|nr:hypothetical protein [Alistipes sp. OttesenSCG-928-B03]
MKKEELVREIYKVKNRINELNGKELIDLTDRRLIGKMDDEAYRGKKYKLEEELESIQKQYDRLVAQKEQDEKTAAFYATAEGQILKAGLESDIEAKIEEWKTFEIQVRANLEEVIQHYLGSHWGVKSMNKGYASIAVIDADKSTPERREFFFGQDIDIRYESRNWLSGGTERFESSCGSCGSFDMTGGQTIGERAMFYVGIGQLYANPELIQAIKEILRNSEAETERISAELDALRKQLANPILA